MRQIRITAAKRPKPDAEVDIVIRHNTAQATVVSLTRQEILDLAIRILTFIQFAEEDAKAIGELE